MPKCVRVCVWWWEALPPILLLLKSSHERPCQDRQCGLSRPDQHQSRLHDAVAHSHTADLRGYCSFCCKDWTQQRWTVMCMDKCKLGTGRETVAGTFSKQISRDG